MALFSICFSSPSEGDDELPARLHLESLEPESIKKVAGRGRGLACYFTHATTIPKNPRLVTQVNDTWHAGYPSP